MKFETILHLARSQGRVIGHDGAAIPVDIADLADEEDDGIDPCGGTGVLTVEFGGVVIAEVPCWRCADG